MTISKIDFTDRKSYRSPKEKKVNGIFKMGGNLLCESSASCSCESTAKTPSTGEIIYTKTLINAKRSGSAQNYSRAQTMNHSEESIGSPKTQKKTKTKKRLGRLKGRNDAVLSVGYESRRGHRVIKAVHLRVNLRAFREPAFDSRPGFGVGFSRSVANGLLELPVLPLLPVP